MLRGRSERIAASPPQIADGLAGMAPAVDESREPVPSTSSARNRNSNFKHTTWTYAWFFSTIEKEHGACEGMGKSRETGSTLFIIVTRRLLNSAFDTVWQSFDPGRRIFKKDKQNCG